MEDIFKNMIEKLNKIQEKLKEKIILTDCFGRLESVGGADVHYRENRGACGFVVMKDGDVIIREVTEMDVKFPYIPGYFAFREAPLIIKTVKKFKNGLDLLFVNGHGIAHPRYYGLACHVGLVLDIPTVGIAKRLLCGEEKGGKIFYKEKVVGYKYRGTYVSPGHKISVETSLRVVRRFDLSHGLPEPLYMAHILAKESV